MKLIYVIAADVLGALGWEVKINEKENYWNLVLTNTNSSDDMPQSHKSCLRGLLRGWLMEFNYEGGHQQVNIYKELHGLSPEDDRYSCLDTCVKRTDSNTPEHDLDDKEIFVRRKDRFDRYVLTEPVAEDITTKLTNDTKATLDTISKQGDNNYHEVCKEHERQIKEFKEDLLIKKAKKCPYYGCAGTRICTYYSWTTHCPFPDCDKTDCWTHLPVYEATQKGEPQ